MDREGRSLNIHSHGRYIPSPRLPSYSPQEADERQLLCDLHATHAYTPHALIHQLPHAMVAHVPPAALCTRGRGGINLVAFSPNHVWASVVHTTNLTMTLLLIQIPGQRTTGGILGWGLMQITTCARSNEAPQRAKRALTLQYPRPLLRCSSSAQIDGCLIRPPAIDSPGRPRPAQVLGGGDLPLGLIG